MSELASLFLLLAVLYLTECLVWLRRDSLAFVVPFWKAGGPVHGDRAPGTLHGGLALLNPLPPLGSAHLAQAWPFSVSPQGVYAYAALSVNLQRSPYQPESYVPFDQVRDVARLDQEVRINGAPFVRAGSRPAAAYFVGLLRRLAELPLDRRAAAIEDELARSLDAAKASERREAFRDRSLELIILCNMLFAFLFVLVPVIIEVKGLLQTWGEILSILALLVAGQAIFHVRALRALYPEEWKGGLPALAIMILFPPAAIRSADAVARGLFASFHPMAIAKILCRPPRFEAFARQVLRDSRSPALPVCPAAAGPAAEVERWYRTRLAAMLHEFARRCGLDPDALLAPPPPADSQCRAFCPRCGAQFRTPAGECQDCGGIPLQALAPPSAPEEGGGGKPPI
jgi:hypothetical protein